MLSLRQDHDKYITRCVLNAPKVTRRAILSSTAMRTKNLLVALGGIFDVVTAITLPSSYDVVWTTPSEVNGSASSMPVGGGDVGLNAWSENGPIGNSREAELY